MGNYELVGFYFGLFDGRKKNRFVFDGRRHPFAFRMFSLSWELVKSEYAKAVLENFQDFWMSPKSKFCSQNATYICEMA